MSASSPEQDNPLFAPVSEAAVATKEREQRRNFGRLFTGLARAAFGRFVTGETDRTTATTAALAEQQRAANAPAEAVQPYFQAEKTGLPGGVLRGVRATEAEQGQPQAPAIVDGVIGGKGYRDAAPEQGQGPAIVDGVVGRSLPYPDSTPVTPGEMQAHAAEVGALGGYNATENLGPAPRPGTSLEQHVGQVRRPQ